MSEELQLIQERIISGKGSLRVPPSGVPLRYALLYLDLIRPPAQAYLNYAYNPPQSRYATLNFLRKGYVISTKAMSYPTQSFEVVGDASGQTLIAVKCAYDGILTSFANVGLYFGADWVSVTDLIKDYNNLDLLWDEVKIVCFSDTAIQARLFKLKYDACDPDKNKTFKPPKPPPPRLRVPPGTPLPDIDIPYPDEPTPYPQGDATPDEKAPIDDYPQPPECAIVQLVITVIQYNGTTRDYPYSVLSPFGNVRLENIPDGFGTYSVSGYIQCHGLPGETCTADFVEKKFAGLTSADLDSTFISATVVVSPS